MRIPLFILFTCCCYCLTHGQKTRSGLWFTPSSCATKRINGLALGPFSGCFKDGEYVQTINGIDIELIGIGFFLPLAGGNGYNWENTLPPAQIVNGLVISLGGFGRVDAVVNGFNLSGVNTMTNKTNGVTTGLLFCTNRHVNGLSLGGVFGNNAVITNGIQIGGFTSASKKMNGLQIGIFNSTKALRGVQIGLLNSAKNMKGLQIGFCNINGKRTLPFLNLQF